MGESKRVGIYVRVSTQDQSCELQKRDLDAFAAARGWDVAGVYEDKGLTGTNGNRPMLKALLKDARERKLDVVLCWKLDRLFRSLKDLVATLSELEELGVSFVSQRDNLDLTTSSGRLMMHMLGAFAEFEANLIQERVRAGLANARAKGKILGRPKVRDDSEIRAHRARGLSIREIAKALGIGKTTVLRALVGVKSSA